MIISTKYPNYFVDEYGNVYSQFIKGKFRLLKQSHSGNGKRYLQVGVTHQDGIRRTTLVHRIMCESWHGDRPPPDDGGRYTVSHLDGDCFNNHRDNLAWEPLRDNHARKIEHGTDDNGWKNSRAKIDRDQLSEIRQRIETGETHHSIAKDYSVARATISKIANGSRYGRV